MGYDMTEGTLVRWLKHEGDPVVVGEVIAEIETDKATVEMESKADGAVLKLLVEEGETVPVGALIAYLGEPGEPLPDAAQRSTPQASPAAVIDRPAPAVTASSRPAADGRSKASPLARKLAGELGVDLAHIAGTGPDGRITRDDVLAVPDRPPTTAPAPRAVGGSTGPRVPGPDGTIQLGKMGQAIARRTQATMNEAPHFYLTVQIDMTEAIALRARLNKALSSKARVSLNAVVMKACAVALQKYPVFNATFEGDHLSVHPHVNIGMAVALPEGLVVPAILECERKSVVEISEAAKDLAERARAGTLRQDEYTGTFSVSNLGMYRVDAFTAIVVAPQVAVLAVGAVQPTPVVRHGEVVVRDMMAVTLSTDHRAANGAEAAQFAAEIKRVLEDPRELAE
jgi:pyruvate dehydrogenase E2 component (dihydrolipoamide acetyltransferase)